MPEYKETTDDYRIKYGGCYALAEGLDEKYAGIVKITDSFDVDAITGKVNRGVVSKFYKTPKNQTRSSEDWMRLEHISLKPLTMGAINLGFSVICIRSRIPDGNAKYRRLPHDGNMELYDPFRKEREFLNWRSPTKIADYFVLKAWAENKYPSAPDALAEVREYKRLGCAFSPQFFFGISKAGDAIFLYKNGRKCARVNAKGDIMLKPKVHCLFEQLSEYGLSVEKIEK